MCTKRNGYRRPKWKRRAESKVRLILLHLFWYEWSWEKHSSISCLTPHTRYRIDNRVGRLSSLVWQSRKEKTLNSKTMEKANVNHYTVSPKKLWQFTNNNVKESVGSHDSPYPEGIWHLKNTIFFFLLFIITSFTPYYYSCFLPQHVGLIYSSFWVLCY